MPPKSIVRWRTVSYAMPKWTLGAGPMSCNCVQRFPSHSQVSPNHSCPKVPFVPPKRSTFAPSRGIKGHCGIKAWRRTNVLFLSPQEMCHMCDSTPRPWGALSRVHGCAKQVHGDGLGTCASPRLCLETVSKQLNSHLCYAARTGVEPNFNISQISAISTETCGNQRVNRAHRKSTLCTNRAELRRSSVRICPKTFSRAISAECRVGQLRGPKLKTRGAVVVSADVPVLKLAQFCH
jgi:hypothetical protein